MEWQCEVDLRIEMKCSCGLQQKEEKKKRILRFDNLPLTKINKHFAMPNLLKFAKQLQLQVKDCGYNHSLISS